MKKIIIFLFFLAVLNPLCAQPVFRDNIFNDNVKTVQLFPENNFFGEAVIFLDNEIPLILKFDEIESDYRSYSYTFIHCDANWKQSDLAPNEYLEGYSEAYIVDYKFSKNTKIPFVNYSLQIPNDDIRIRYSGNYILLVYPENDLENPIFTKRFYVIEPSCTIAGNIVAASNPEQRNSAQEINFKINISQTNSRFPSREITTQIQQNGRFDNQILDLKPLSIKDDILDFNLQKGNIFKGLNTFRFFDFSSLSYNSEYVYSIDRSRNIDYIELILSKFRANTFYKNEPSQFGKFFIDTKEYSDKDSEGEYALVHFLLASENPIPDSDIYILGWIIKLKIN